MVFEPLLGSLRVPSAIEDHHGRDVRFEDVKHEQGVLLIDRSGGLLPLALDKKPVRELLFVDDKEVCLADTLEDSLAYRNLLSILLAPDRVSVGEYLLLVVPKLGIAVFFQGVLYE